MSDVLQNTRAAHIVTQLRPYLVCTPYNLPFMNLAPFGLPIDQKDIINPLHTRSETFLDLLQRMDALTFGPEGMPMARWVFYDASELPGGIFGFGLPVAQIAPEIKEHFEIPADYDGLLPFSMYIAIPTPEKKTWFGHNLASLNPVFPAQGLKGLGTVTKAIGLKTYQCDVQVGATQWDSEALFIHTRFGPLELETAYTPAHSEHRTLTYLLKCTDKTLMMALGDPRFTIQRPSADFWIKSSEPESMRALQLRIEAGERFCIPAKPRIVSKGQDGHGAVFEVPVAQLS